MTPTSPPGTEAASAQVTARIQALADWRGATLAHVRRLIHEADAGIQEQIKWGGTPVWCLDGIVCTGESYQRVVKLTFARGASLADPAGLFNASLEGRTRRAIDLREGVAVDEAAFRQLIAAAVAANTAATTEHTASRPTRRKPPSA